MEIIGNIHPDAYQNHDLIAVIDAGTTGIRCCIVRAEDGSTLSRIYFPLPTSYPKPGRVEQDPNTIIELAYRAVRTAIASEQVDPHRIAGLCIATQRNSFVPMDAEGRFLTNMIVWQDQRGEEAHEWILERLQANNISVQDLYRINGQPFSSFQGGFKVLWMRKFREELYKKTYKIVTPLAFLGHAFGVEEYIDDNNNQSFWLVANADTQRVDADLCRLFDIDPEIFLKSVPSGTKIGEISKEAAKRSGLIAGTGIYLGSGDQQCGVLGAGNFGTSDIISVCMGTAGLGIAYSSAPIRHPGSMCQIQGHPAGGYLMESHSSSCMSSYNWAEKIFFSTDDSGALLGKKDVQLMMTEAAKHAPVGSNGVFFLPWLQGASCPHYDDTARGAYIGMSLASSKSDMIRSTMEGICFETRMMLETLLEADIPPVKSLRALGGASTSDYWNQMQADIFGLPVETVVSREASALGAAIICAVSVGMYKDYREASGHMTHINKIYVPDMMNKMQYDELYGIWDSCYKDLSRGSFKSIYGYQTR